MHLAWGRRAAKRLPSVRCFPAPAVPLPANNWPEEPVAGVAGPVTVVCSVGGARVWHARLAPRARALVCVLRAFADRDPSASGVGGVSCTPGAVRSGRPAAWVCSSLRGSLGGLPPAPVPAGSRRSGCELRDSVTHCGPRWHFHKGRLSSLLLTAFQGPILACRVRCGFADAALALRAPLRLRRLFVTEPWLPGDGSVPAGCHCSFS